MKTLDCTASQSTVSQLVASSNDNTRLSIQEARRIMGKASKAMSDADIEKAIFDLTAIAKAYIKSVPK